MENILACLTESALPPEVNSSINCIEVESSLIHIKTAADLFLNNAAVLALDFKRLTKGRKSAPISSSNQLIAPENIFLEEGAKVECAILNAAEGPIYIGKNAEGDGKGVCCEVVSHYASRLWLKWALKFIVERP